MKILTIAAAQVSPAEDYSGQSSIQAEEAWNQAALCRFAGNIFVHARQHVCHAAS